MEEPKTGVSRGTLSLESGRTKFLCISLLFLLLLGACETCVTGTVSQEGVPLEGVRVELNGDGCPDGYRYTDRNGAFCFGDLPASRDCVLSAWFGDPVEAPFNTGEKAGTCRSGLCQRVDLTFVCDVQDPLEPNDTFESASIVSLPYSNPLAALCPAGDVDFYRMEVPEEGKVLIAETFYPETGASLDSYLGLMDSNFDILETDDSDGDGSYSKIIYPFPQVGTYYIAVTHWRDYGFVGDHESTGTYGIDIRLADPACGNVRVQENGQPLEGASVRTSTGPYASCTTDATGSCCFASAVGDERCYTVHHPSTWDSLDVCTRPEEPGSCEQGSCTEVIADFDYTCVSGAVTRNGQPVEEAEVRGPYGYVNTGSDGLYCLRAPEGSEAEIRVEDPVLCESYPGALLTGADGSCTEGGCDPMDFELPGLACVEVTVSRDLEPVEEARVYPPSGCQYSLETGDDGKVCFPAEADAELLLRVSDPMFGGDSYEIVQTGNGGSCEEGRCTTTEIALTGKACVRGTVYWGDGEPAANIQVRRPNYGAGYETYTDGGGHYCIVVPKGETVGLRFHDSVYGIDRTRYVTASESGSCERGNCTTLDVTFPATSCISGTVSRTDGEPPMGVTVCLDPWNNFCVEPDQEGLYCLRAPIHDEARLTIEDAVTEIWQVEYVDTGEASTCAEGGCTEVNFELPGVACVMGVVTREDGDGGGSHPEEGAQVCLGFSEDLCVETGTGGEYCLPAGMNSQERIEVIDPILGVIRSGYAETGTTGSCDAGNCATLDLQLQAATCMSGQVREGTTPLEGAEVINGFATVHTDPRGRYCIPALANQESHWIQANHPTDEAYVVYYPGTGNGGSCNEGGCTTQDFTFD